MKLRTKLMIAPAITAGMLVLVLVVALWALESFKSKSGDRQTSMIDDHQKISTLQAQLSEAHIDLYRTMAVVNSMGDKTVKAFREKRIGVLSKLAALSQSQSMAASSETKVKDSLALFAKQINSYKKNSDLAIELSTEAPNADAMKKADEDYKTLDHTLTTVVASMQSQATQATADLASEARQSAVMVGVFGGLAAIGSISFAWIIQRRINSNIRSAARAAQLVASGRLDELPQSDDRDEIGDLVRSLGRMVEQLRGSILAVREASHSIHTASTEIATGNLDLSHRTEQAASNLQQAASSMDTLTGTVTQSANSAQEATRFAASAAEVAARGSVEVSNVVSTMHDINESSKKIGDIIGVIDGIAFQTNILALNAAVEAARAGEQGRGFAVVAGEVRSLAGRSAQAAREIKTLIRGSMDRVEAGSRLVASAGNTMEEIMVSVQRVSGIIEQISTSASEQSSGISQINASVLHLDHVTQQNAALVEQGAAAAENLKDQASLLSTVVGKFQLTRTP